jgi:single-stranded-DNA-specific exonuclease
MGAYLDLVVPGDKVDIAYTMNEFCFRGETSLSLHLCDLKIHSGTGFMWAKAGVAEKLYSNGLSVKQIAKMAPGENILPDMIPHPEDFGTCYRTASKLAGDGTATVDCDLFAKLVNVGSNDKITPFRVKRCLEIFADSGLLRLGSTGPMRVCFSMMNVDQKVKLSESAAYKRIMNEQE